jgi:DNA-binding NarL/FixJ family response regulator
MKLGVISRLALSRRGLCALLASSKNCSIVLELPAIPADSEDLLKAKPDVVLFHTNGDDSEFEAISRLRAESPEIKLLIILDTADEQTEFKAIQAGGAGCVSSASDPDLLLSAIAAVGRGEIWARRRVASQLIEKLRESEAVRVPASNGLTPKEWCVLGLLASGSRNKGIANRLSISENTVKTHLYTIYRKINVDSRLAATLYYFEHAKTNGKLGGEPAAPVAAASNGSRRARKPAGE